MDAYLQDSWHSTNADLLRQWLTPVLTEGHRHIYLIGDGSFSEASLTAGTLSWQPVFTTEPMSQYQEMGLFIAQIEPNDLGVRISRVVYSLIDKSSIEVSHKELSYSTTYGV